MALLDLVEFAYLVEMQLNPERKVTVSILELESFWLLVQDLFARHYLRGAQVGRTLTYTWWDFYAPTLFQQPADAVMRAVKIWVKVFEFMENLAGGGVGVGCIKAKAPKWCEKLCKQNSSTLFWRSDRIAREFLIDTNKSRGHVGRCLKPPIKCSLSLRPQPQGATGRMRNLALQTLTLCRWQSSYATVSHSLNNA